MFCPRAPGIDEATAGARLREDDRERERFVRQAFGRDIEDAYGYDLVVNSCALSQEAAADAVAAALNAKLTTPD